MAGIFNWKSIAALGLSVVGIIFALKMDSNQATEVSIHAIDAYCKEVFSSNEED